MRLLVILASFAASSVAAMIVLVLLGWIDSGSLSFDRIGYIAPLFVSGAASGALFSLPIAIPTIAFTEWTRFHSIWIFVAAGLATGVVLLAVLGSYTLAEIVEIQAYVVRDLIVVFAVTVTASLTYWLVAWRLFPPKTHPAMVEAAPE